VERQSNINGDIWVRRYGAGGTEEWTETYAGSAAALDRPDGVAVDDDLNVFAAGIEVDAAESARVWARLYDNLGGTEWTHLDGSVGNNFLGIRGAAAAADGTFVVSGFADEYGVNERVVWARKFMPNGDVLWTRTAEGAPGFEGEGRRVAVDLDGAVVVTGKMEVAGEGENVWLGKWSPQGDLLWDVTYDGGQGADDEGVDVEIDPAGYIAVAGTVDEGDMNIFAARFSPDGDRLWTWSHDGGNAFSGDQGKGVAVDPVGTIWVVGLIYIESAHYERFAAKLSP
jgi:hypothetical protein